MKEIVFEGAAVVVKAHEWYRLTQYMPVMETDPKTVYQWSDNEHAEKGQIGQQKQKRGEVLFRFICSVAGYRSVSMRLLRRDQWYRNC